MENFTKKLTQDPGDEKQPLPLEPAEPTPGRYRHYKGGEYTVLCLARHSETEEWMVVYRSEKEHTLWVRPQKMWIEDIAQDLPRFSRIEPTP